LKGWSSDNVVLALVFALALRPQHILNLLNFVRAQRSLKLNAITTICFLCLFLLYLGKCVFPEELAKELPNKLKIPKCVDVIACTMILPISTCKQNAKNTPYAFKHVPHLF